MCLHLPVLRLKSLGWRCLKASREILSGDLFSPEQQTDMSGQVYATAALSPGKEPPRTQWIGGYMGLKAGLNALRMENLLPS
jgi:hypothetical protein